MSGGSSTNSWTILGPEEPVADTLRPLAEGTSTGLTGNNQSADASASSEGRPVEDDPVSKKEDLNEDSGSAHCTGVASSVTDAPVHSLDVSGGAALSQSEDAADAEATQSSASLDSSSKSYSRLTASPLEPSLASTETAGGPELLEDNEGPTHEATLQHEGGEGLQAEGEGPDLSPRIPDPGMNESCEDVGAGEERTEHTGAEGEPGVRRRRSLLATLEQIGRTDEEEEGEEEFQLPQREDDSVFTLNKCILGAVILLGLGTIFFSGVFMDLEEEADYGTKELKDSGVAGKQEWHHPEAPPPPVDVDSSELLNKISQGKEQILMLQAQLQAQNEELKVAKGQAADGASERLRWQEEHSRLKKEVASLPLLQKENERMRRELQNVPALQKELETLRSTVTQLKQLSVSVASSPRPGGRPGDRRQSSPDGPGPEKVKERKEKYDKGEKKEWKESKIPERKEREKKERKDGGTEWQEKTKWKDEEDKLEGKQRSHGDDKRWKEKEKVSRGDEGKQWKDREDKERKERSERKEWKDEGERKKYERKNEGTGWRGKEERNDRRGGRDHKEEWKKVKDGHKEGDREQWRKEEKEDEWRHGGSKEEGKGKDERKHKENRNEWRDENRGEDDWRRKEERKQGRENERRDKNRGQDEWRRKEERKQWRENEWRDKNGGEDEWRKKEERKQGRENEWRGKNGGEDEWRKKEERRQGRENEWRGKNGGEDEWRKKGERKQWEKKERKEKKHGDTSALQTEKDEHRLTSHRHGDEHLWGDRKPPHTHLTPDQPEYWSWQRTRLQRGPPQRCGSLEACARAEGLLPVPFPDFHGLLQTYLDKAEQGGAAVAPAQREELGNLVTEFFKDGVFVHDRLNFQDFTEDVGDILEDLVEEEEGEGEGEESAVEKEMEGFEREVMKTFAAPGEKKERMKGEGRESGGVQGG